MYVNAKKKNLLKLPGIRGGEDEREQWKGKFKYDVFEYCKNLCKYYNVLLSSTTIKKSNTPQKTIKLNLY
jgi:hypothetical protein